jgi:hypothetical protein
MLRPLEPLAVGEAGEQPVIEPAARALVEVLEVGGGVLESRLAQQRGEAPAAAVGDLALDEQREAVFERQGLRTRQRELLLERVGHAVELEGSQLVEGLLDDHRSVLLRVTGNNGVRGGGRARERPSPTGR